MQETTPDDLSASKPLPTASASSSRRRSYPPAIVAAGSSDPSPTEARPSSGRPSSSSTRPATSSTRPPTASSSSSRPLSPPSYPSGSYQDFQPPVAIPASYAKRPSSPTVFGSAPASASYQSRTGRMYHPYAASPADFSEANSAGPRYVEGPRRPSLRGQHSFEGRLPDHARPYSAPYALDPPPHDALPPAAASYPIPTGYDPSMNVSPYPPSPGTTVYPPPPPPVPAAYSVQPSVFQSSVYAPYTLPQGPPPPSAPHATFYGDSPHPSAHSGRPSSGDAHTSMSAPSRYQPLPAPVPAPTGYYTEPRPPVAEQHSYQQPYVHAGSSQQAQHIPGCPPSSNGSLHGQPYYPLYTQQPAMQPPVPHDAGLGLFNPAYDDSPLGAAVYRQPASIAPPPARPPPPPHYHPVHNSQAPPPPPLPSHDGQQQPYPEWAFGN
jgi:hypothetical protein